MRGITEITLPILIQLKIRQYFRVRILYRANTDDFQEYASPVLVALEYLKQTKCSFEKWKQGTSCFVDFELITELEYDRYMCGRNKEPTNQDRILVETMFEGPPALVRTFFLNSNPSFFFLDLDRPRKSASRFFF